MIIYLVLEVMCLISGLSDDFKLCVYLVFRISKCYLRTSTDEGTLHHNDYCVELTDPKIYLDSDLFKISNISVIACMIYAYTSPDLYLDRVIRVNMRNLIAFVQEAAR